ncbi:MAG: hypothetical protein ACRDZR_01510 [Acidimicrobiales bacterium]
MTQPSFVPITEADQVRAARRLHVPGPWSPDRPAEIRVPVRRHGRMMGTPGPDQGFALRLARRFEDRLHLTAGEHAEDVLAGASLLASRRAGLFGRAPSVHDLVAALSLWGFLGDAPPELVAARKAAFQGAAHDYDVQRALVDSVPEASLRLAPDEVGNQVGGEGWRTLVGVLVSEATPAPA